MAVESPTCILCQQLLENNKQGLYIKGCYICHKCEARITVLSRDDLDYDYYKWGLKKIWSWPSA